MAQADKQREHMSKELLEHYVQVGIQTEPSPPYAIESNGADQSLVQNIGQRTRVISLATNLPANLWDKPLYHANWLPNRLPS